MTIQPLKGQKALVTGASSGIGAGVAIALGQAGADVVVNYSGNAAGAVPVVAAIEAARGQGLATIGFTGQGGGRMAALCDVCIRIPSTSTPRIQEGHEVLGHALCALIEATLFPRAA